MAEILHSTPSALRKLARGCDGSGYHFFNVKNTKGKIRSVQNPKPELKEIQVHLNRLLQKIRYPDYMMAGVKGMSYEKNAEVHLGLTSTRVCTVDINKFYPNCQRGAVKRCLESCFLQSPDVANLVADLVCLQGHLPTGGPASLLFSYWSNKDVFDHIKMLADEAGLTMTVYVDDMTFSGEKAGRKFLYDCVLPTLTRAGLRGHKIKAFHCKAPQEITGVVLRKGKTELPYRRFRDINKDELELNKSDDPKAKLKLFNRIISRLHSISSFQPSAKTKAKFLEAERKILLREHRYLQHKQKFGRQHPR